MKYLIDKIHDKLCIDLSEVSGISQIKLKENKDDTWYYYFEIAFKGKAALLVVILNTDESRYSYRNEINTDDYNALIAAFSKI